MIDPIRLLAFVPAALALNPSRGADIMFCLAHGMRGGARAAILRDVPSALFRGAGPAHRVGGRAAMKGTYTLVAMTIGAMTPAATTNLLNLAGPNSRAARPDLAVAPNILPAVHSPEILP